MIKELTENSTLEGKKTNDMIAEMKLHVEEGEREIASYREALKKK